MEAEEGRRVTSTEWHPVRSTSASANRLDACTHKLDQRWPVDSGEGQRCVRLRFAVCGQMQATARCADTKCRMLCGAVCTTDAVFSTDKSCTATTLLQLSSAASRTDASCAAPRALDARGPARLPRCPPPHEARPRRDGWFGMMMRKHSSERKKWKCARNGWLGDLFYRYCR
eukprot:1905840-Rhodomonas_salina.2